ncbi:efflux RND transporter periplasmic adaptor subunit [Defluviimonas sp. SAOS-178_SWC]|uniref:efflux RND transporter periplasmic adaptor subunit n=1 Tax=Defluviimonas sp. SAOS-178_SWC TaxID=3121287 RepID=UPI0032213A2C
MAEKVDDISALLHKEAHGRRWVGALTVLLLVAVAVGGWVFWSGRDSAGGRVIYLTEAATRGTLTVTVIATGTVQPTRQVDVSSELSGTLVEVAADYNDQVQAGAVLARLDDTKLKAQVANSEAALDAAKARVAQAEANLYEAESNYEAQGRLDKLGATSRRDFIGYETTYKNAKAALSIAEADVVLAEAALSSNRSDLEKTVIRSPINGVVLDRAADPGQIVASSLSAPTLFTIAEDLTAMELRVDVDEADIGKVRVGNMASFTVDAYSGRAFSAEITQVRYAPETTDGVVTYKAVLTVENDDLALRPGMTATAAITVDRVEDALQVPNAALRYAPPQIADEGGNGSGLLGLIMPRRPSGSGSGATSGRSVWVLRGGVAVEVPVETGASDGRQTVILSGEVAEGDAVITDQSEAG